MGSVARDGMMMDTSLSSRVLGLRKLAAGVLP
jgi:hypothetical protein